MLSISSTTWRMYPAMRWGWTAVLVAVAAGAASEPLENEDYVWAVATCSVFIALAWFIFWWPKASFEDEALLVRNYVTRHELRYDQIAEASHSRDEVVLEMKNGAEVTVRAVHWGYWLKDFKLASEAPGERFISEVMARATGVDAR